MPQPWSDRQDDKQRETFRAAAHGPHNGDHVRLSILGAVCPRTGEFFAIEASHCDTDVFQAFLDEAARSIRPARQRNILVLDNASWHKRQSINRHFFEPFYPPLYSPDLNPIERLWLVIAVAKSFSGFDDSSGCVCQEKRPYRVLDSRFYFGKLYMKSEHFCNIHCPDRQALIQRADIALRDLVAQPKKVASANNPSRT